MTTIVSIVVVFAIAAIVFLIVIAVIAIAQGIITIMMMKMTLKPIICPHL